MFLSVLKTDLLRYSSYIIKSTCWKPLCNFQHTYRSVQPSLDCWSLSLGWVVLGLSDGFLGRVDTLSHEVGTAIFELISPMRRVKLHDVEVWVGLT